ncbi:MAG: tetratricopeptide repeat protein [bacterium]|nr:tetratricopeptide repeat protein [bacterium]
MARQRINVRKEIEIERNPIEKKMMEVSKFIKGNRKKVLYSLGGILVAVVLLIVSLIIYDGANKKAQLRFYQVVEDYNKYSGPEGEKTEEKVNKTINDLKELIDSTSIGFVNEMSLYFLGNVYFAEKKYKEAKDYLLQYEDTASSPVFAVIALQKAAIAAEELKDLDGALKIYKRFEKDVDYTSSVVADQVYYNMGRVHKKKGDIKSARKSYNDLIKGFPNSKALVQQAQKRLALLGLKK